MARYGRVDTESVKAAKEAIAVFRGMQPMLSSYAQALTGRDDIQVVLSATNGASTDNNKIYYRPPTSLGRRSAHESWLCDQRGPDGLMRCRACAEREDVLVDIYHEIAHIWFGSFAEVSDRAKKVAIEASLTGLYTDTPYGEAIRKRIAEAPAARGYMSLASLISPWMKVLVNSLEDARIENHLFRALPGTQVMLAADVSQVFTQGIESTDPRTGEVKTVMWRDRKLNEQVCVALYCKAADYDYRGWFDPWVVSTLDDPDLEAMVQQVRDANEIGAVFTNAFPILALLRERYGYFKSKDDPAEPEPPAEEEPDAGEEGSDSGSDSEEDRNDGDEGESSGEDSGDSDEEEGREEVDEDADGGDPSESSSAGRPEDLEDADEDSGGDPGDPGDSAGDGEGDAESADEVPEEGDGSGSPESGTAAGSGDSGSDGDGGDSGGGLDGLSDSSSGEPGDGESSGESGSDGGRPAGSTGGTPGAGEDLAGPSRPDIDFGEFDDSEKIVAEASGHHEADAHTGDRDEHFTEVESEASKEAMTLMIAQGDHFDEPSMGLSGVKVYKKGDPHFSVWGSGDASVRPPEALIASTLMKARTVFAANLRGKHERGLKRGRVHSSSLAAKAPFNDPRMFERKTLPGRQSYFVGIGLDISGSTGGINIDLIKRLAYAEAELLTRLNIPFFMYAHTGGSARGGRYDLMMHEIKAPDEPWTQACKTAVEALQPYAANLDGHTLEFYRKILDTRRETTRIMHYYSDGAMPMENGPEERRVLVREIKTCKLRGYKLVGVGVRSDAPKAYGLETVLVNRVGDIKLIVDDLEKRLIGR